MSLGWSPGKAETVTVSTVFARRLEFDAYRSDLEEMSLGQRDAAAMVRIEMAQHDYQVHREKYERLRSDVTIKLKFLEENKVCSFSFVFERFLLVLRSSGLTFHAAAVVHRWTAGPCDNIVRCGYRCSSAHVWPRPTTGISAAFAWGLWTAFWMWRKLKHIFRINGACCEAFRSVTAVSHHIHLFNYA